MNWLKLGVPLLLGLAAGAINWMAMNSGEQSEEFVRLSENLSAGTTLSEDHIEKVVIRGDPGSLKQTAVPYANRLLLKNWPLGRNLKKGDLVLWRDVTPPASELTLPEGEWAYPVSLEGVTLPPRLIQVGDMVGFILAVLPPAPKDKEPVRTAVSFEFVEPFTVVSLGDIVTRRASLDPKGELEGRAGQQRSITIALKRNPGGGMDAKTEKLVRARHEEQGGVRRVVEMVLQPRPREGQNQKPGK